MSYTILNHVIEQKIILFPSFFASMDSHAERSFHSHNCIEMSYVMEGTADHYIILPDGTTHQQKLCAGNYIILDPNAQHAYKNGSPDFQIMNLLSKMSMLEHSVTENRSINSTKAFSVTRSHWHEDKRANDIELRFALNNPQPLGDNRYILLWLDLKGDKTPIDFSKAQLGLITDHDLLHPWVPIRADSKQPFYFFGENESRWVTLYHGKDGYFGTDSGSSVKGLRGWFAFPIQSMKRADAPEPTEDEEIPENELTEKSTVTGVYFYCAMNDPAMAGSNLYLDTISLIKDYRTAELGSPSIPPIIDFGKMTIGVNVTAKDGRTDPELHTEQICVSISENKDFYTLIKELYPQYKYSKIQSTPVNRVYFDKDGNVRSLFQVCYDASRKNMHEWHKMVYHALSLIILISLQSFDKYLRSKKDTIIDVVKKHVDAHFAENVTLTEICAKYFYSLPYVSHKFKEVLNCSFEQYVRQLRIRHACELLLKSHLSVDEIAEGCGYTSVRSFRKAFHCVVGCSPLEFKAKYTC
ncbi:MAG: helix-turn-helix transcriptional regulator [Clostridia bacterium]|nr:helix-turn-helix transcriptional regulator [Clostridia bacterium]